MQRWQIGAVTVATALEADDVLDSGFVQRHVIPAATPEALAALPWLEPTWLAADGGARLVTQAFLVVSQGRRIVVDTCIGNDKERTNPAFHKLQRPFLAALERAGARPEQVDVVLCTHLHFDHVGWNTRWDGARWVPTFPNARYLFARTEWDHWTAHGGIDYVLADSVRPVADAGLVDLVAVPHAVTDEVTLVPTPGHTPGHVSVRIRSGGAEATITGDMIHHPCQVGRPEWTGAADSDPEQAHRTRAAFVEDAASRDVLVLGTHFPAPSGGRVRQAPGGGRALAPERSDP